MSALSTPINRRRFLGALGASAAIVAGVGGGGCRPGRDTRRTFRFLVVNDLHHASAACDSFLAELVEHMRPQTGIEFVLIVGDLADQGAPASLHAVRDQFSHLGLPVHCVPGNHDCDVEQTTRLYAEVFPDQLNYTFAHAGWRFVGLDSTDGNAWGNTTIQPATLDWLDATLPTLDRKQPTILFTHFPLIPGLHPTLPLTPGNAEEVLARFDGFNLRCAFTGHYHARTERPRGSATILTNCCCARVRDNHDDSVPEGYLACTAHPDGRLEREFVRFAPAERSPVT